uniref:Uncharacterized protein n=1 Tax=Mola mola TaxID=94237 RepID=A0A3Q3W4M9_MOLML
MASASPFLSEDQFLCAICLEVFTEPVSIPCGHNFCKACIGRHWDGKEQCQCPLCNQNFDRGLKLCVNVGFREVVEGYRKQQRIGDNDHLVKPGQVPCDCCLGNKSRASKTCLVCLTSFCEAHLEPHQRVPALKRHKLTNPVHDLENKICKVHNRIFDPFCWNKLTNVCDLCTQHSAPDTVPLEEPCAGRRALMGKKKAQAQEIKAKRGKRVKKSSLAVQSRKAAEEANSVESASSSVHLPYISFAVGEPHRLNKYLYLPENMAVCKGKFFFEVETKERSGWFLGVVRESNFRKRTFSLNTRDGSWIIRLQNNMCTALQFAPVSFHLTRKPESVTVFLDYDNGILSFYDADTANLIYTFIDCKFRGSICSFYATDDVSNPRTQKVKTLYIIISFIVMVFFLIHF